MLRLDFINVGYGDSILIQSISQNRVFRILVDCGDGQTAENRPGQKRTSACEFLQRRNIRTLDVLVLTHMHTDHVGGLTALTETVEIREVWTSYIPEETLFRTYKAGSGELLEEGEKITGTLYAVFRALNRLREKGVPVRLMRGETNIPFADWGFDLTLSSADDSLFREQELAFQAISRGADIGDLACDIHSVMNDTSLRIRITCGRHGIELPGDFCAAAWLKSKIQPCTLLKLPHHGHPDSMTEELFTALSPAVTVISVSGDRMDDCPAKAVVDLIRQNHSELLFTGITPPGSAKDSTHETVQVVLDQDSLRWSYQ